MAKRSGPEWWLLGGPTERLSTARLPTRGDVLGLSQKFHIVDKYQLQQGFRMACDEALLVWGRARIPTMRIDGCIRKIKALFDEYIGLKKHRTWEGETERAKEAAFKDSLSDLFHIGAKNALSNMKNDEDKYFYKKQQEDVFSCCMAGVDMTKTRIETRKRARDESLALRKEKATDQETTTSSIVPQSSSSCSSEESQEEDIYSPSMSYASSSALTPKRPKNIFTTSDVASALDRVNLPDRGAAFVAGSVAKALGYDISDLTLSRSSIRCSRRQARADASVTDHETFHYQGPLLLHWDGKMLPDFTGNELEMVDRIAILVTAPGFEKMLGIPKIKRGTGEAQATACITELDRWHLRSHIRGLVFDTTASNTGLHRGACALIEDSLGRELVWVACRHHILEVVLSSAFIAVFGLTGAPETGLFKRFRKDWTNISTDSYIPAPTREFEEMGLQEQRVEMLLYLEKAIQEQQPRADYAELLDLCFLFLGGKKDNVKFRRPGATHHARWMGKALYALKLYMFNDKFKLTAREGRAVKSLSLFVSIIYIRHWNEAPLATKAPLNDLALLQAVESYPDETIGSSTRRATKRHLWYLAEHLVGFSFFDDRVDIPTKRRMVQNLKKPKKEDNPRRLTLVGREEATEAKLDGFVTKRTTVPHFFSILSWKEGGRRPCKGFSMMILTLGMWIQRIRV